MNLRVTAPKNAIAAALLVATAGFICSELIERVGGLVPCELCLIQRWSVFAAAVLLGLSLWPGRWVSVSGCAGAALATLTSILAAVRHVWLQIHPGEPLGCLPDIFGHSAAAASAPAVGSGLAALANPLQAIAPAPSACSAPQAVKLGFTLADWSLAYAVILTVLVAIAFVAAIRVNRRVAARTER